MPIRYDFTNRAAVVTGGAQGIGRATVEKLVSGGAAVAIWDRDKAFAERSVNKAVVHQGLFFGGGGRLLLDQFIAAVVTFAFSFVVTWLIAKAIQATIGLRVTPDQEDIGLDQALHVETAYASGDLGSARAI